MSERRVAKMRGVGAGAAVLLFLISIVGVVGVAGVTGTSAATVETPIHQSGWAGYFNQDLDPTTGTMSVQFNVPEILCSSTSSTGPVTVNVGVFGAAVSNYVETGGQLVETCQGTVPSYVVELMVDNEVRGPTMPVAPGEILSVHATMSAARQSASVRDLTQKTAISYGPFPGYQSVESIMQLASAGLTPVSSVQFREALFNGAGYEFTSGWEDYDQVNAAGKPFLATSAFFNDGRAFNVNCVNQCKTAFGS